MKNYLYILGCLVAFLLGAPLSAYGQTDTTNAWFSNGPPGLLIVTSVEINPNFPDTIFAGSLGGTVARSVNRGSSWTTVGSSIADSVLALRIAPSSTAVIYAGTLNRGVYKSTDHGVTWAATGLTGVQVSAVAVDPKNVNRVYAGTRDSLMKSTDGGTNWVKANLDSVNVTTIVMNPHRPDTVFVGTDGRGLLRSFNDGATWSILSNGLSNARIAELAVHPTQAETLYVATSDAGAFRSTNGGDSWDASNNGLTDQALVSLRISPSAPNVIYVGSTTGKVFKSTDNAGIWSDITRNLTFGVPISALSVAPDSSNVVYVGTGPLSNLGVQRLKQTGLGTITSFATGIAPEAIVAGDFNGDAVTDLVVANGGENDLSVFLTSSFGSVLTRNDFRVGSGPVMVRAGDLDGDGDLDLVAANHIKRTLSVLFNDSTGGFASPVDLFAGGPVRVLALADLDGDQDIDIATAEGDAGTLLIYRNDGAGSFEAPELVSVVDGISDLTVADLTGDGIPDLALVSQSQNRMVLLINLGNATFDVNLGTPIGKHPAHLVAADFDIDGDIDLALSNVNNQVSVFTNANGFDLTAPTNYSLPDTVSGLAVADVDLDQYPDLLIPTANGRVAALVNDGNGVFSATLDYGTISSVGRVAVADLNSDGQLDIVVTNPSNNALTVFANTVVASIKAPAPPIEVVAKDAQADLGGNAKLTWKRPRVDETTGRVVAYRVMRASNNSAFTQIARVDTSASKSVDLPFVFRSYVDSNATVGTPYRYHLLSESSGGTLSVPSDTVSTTTKAQPFFDFAFSGNSPYHLRDTIEATIRLNLIGHDVQSFSLFLGVDTASVKILDQDGSVPGVQPIAVDLGLAQARVLQNRIDPLDARKMDFGLGFLPTLNDSVLVVVGTFRIVARKDTTTLIQVLNDTSAARQTVLTGRSDGALIQPFVLPASKLIFRRHRLRGTIALQGRTSDDRAIDVRLDLTQNTALGTALTTPYVSPDDADLNKSGVQLVLSHTGTFALSQIPVGKYSLFAKAFHYLRGRVSTDSVVVTDAFGIADANFKWVAADSSLIVPELRAGDSNNDNRVDLADFGLLASHFGASGFGTESPAWGADFNGDGVINLADFALLQSNFGEIGMGSAVVNKPAIVASRLTRDKHQFLIDDTVDVVGISVDVVADEVFELGDVVLGDFWKDSNPLTLIRQMGQANHVRLAAVLPNGKISGAGIVFEVPSLPKDVSIDRVRILMADGGVVWAGGAELSSYVLGEGLPQQPALSQNFPNPFNPDTIIPFAVSDPTPVMLTVYSSLGQVVRALVQDVVQPGYHQLIWDGRDNTGKLVSSGVYLIRFQHGNFVDVRKALLVK
ncbi:MAG: hypothetical protein HN521_15900 [Candidatus Latescibacteria bacterium]|nr:hypothetical protein [Candidatus Latescibacterota bacterium]